MHCGRCTWGVWRVPVGRGRADAALTCRVTVISSWVSKPKGLCFLSQLSNVMDTEALLMPAWPFLYTRSCRFDARTCTKKVTWIIQTDKLRCRKALRGSVRAAYLWQIGNAQQKAYRVQDVGLAAAVEPGDGVERQIKPIYLRPLSIGLEAVQDDRLDIHLPRDSARLQTHLFLFS